MGRIFYSLKKNSIKDVDFEDLKEKLQNIKENLIKYKLGAKHALKTYYDPTFMEILVANYKSLDNNAKETVNEFYPSFYHPNAEKTFNSYAKLLYNSRHFQYKQCLAKDEEHYKEAIPKHKAEAIKGVLGVDLIINSINAEISGGEVINEENKPETLPGIKEVFNDLLHNKDQVGINLKEAYEGTINLMLFYKNCDAFLKVIKICEGELKKYTNFKYISKTEQVNNQLNKVTFEDYNKQTKSTKEEDLRKL